MSLQEKLQGMKAASAAKVSPEIGAVMQQTTQRLVASDILQGAIQLGEKIADFTLADSAGNDVSLRELRQQGPVVISLYRGVW